MIKNQTLDEAIIEIARTLKALKKLRAIRQNNRNPAVLSTGTVMMGTGPGHVTSYEHISQVKEHAAAKRASMDLTRKLADLRAGR